MVMVVVLLYNVVNTVVKYIRFKRILSSLAACLYEYLIFKCLNVCCSLLVACLAGWLVVVVLPC